MTRTLIILFLTLSLCSFGQRLLSSSTITDIQKIDSLFRKLNKYSDVFMSMDFKRKIYRVCYNTYDTTTKPMPDILCTTTSITTHCDREYFNDTVALKRICNESNISYSISLNILELMNKNKFLMVCVANQDCENCGILIYFKSKKAFAIKNNATCKNETDCYWRLTINKKAKIKYKIKTTNITTNISTLRIKKLFL